MSEHSRRSFMGGLIGWMVAMPAMAKNFWATPDPAASLRRAYLDACGSTEVSEGLRLSCRAAGVTLPAGTWNFLVQSFANAKADALGFHQWFVDKTVEDFRNERVVRVDGWVISETEFLLFCDPAFPVV